MSDPPVTVPESIRPWGEPALDPPTRAGELGTLGRYRVLEKLGQGGMGAVYLGFHDALNRTVALKVMLPQCAAQPVARERFLREARAAAMVKSDHVVTIFDVDEAGGVPFIAMEHLLGAPLDQFLKTEGELPLPHALRVAREVALGLADAHGLGLIHRDIKPGNVWLEHPKGRVKLLDFGLARGPGDEQLTGDGAVMGTPAYMSPEQGRGQKVDHRTDLFSLGTLLYRLCTGKMPFTGDGAMAVLTSLAVDTPTPPRDLNPELPEAVAAIITRLLEKNPAARYQSAQDVADALAGAATGPLPTVVAVPAPQTAVGAQTTNVWEEIADSGTGTVPLMNVAEPTLTDDAPARPNRRPARWPLALAAAAVLAAVGSVVAVAMWPKGQSGVTQNDEPQSPKADKHPVARPKEVFSLDHLDPAKHVPADERYSWQPKELVAVLGSHRQRIPTQVNAVAVSPDGATVLAEGNSFDAVTGRLLDRPAFTAYSPDGKRAASGNRIWALADLQQLPDAYDLAAGDIRTFLADDVVLCAHDHGRMAVWRLDPKGPKSLGGWDGVTAFAASGGRTSLAVFGSDRRLRVFDLAAGVPKERCVLPAGEKPAALAISDRGRLAVLDAAGETRVWDVTGAKPELRGALPALFGEVVCDLLAGDTLVLVCRPGFQVWSCGGDKPQRVAVSREFVAMESVTGAAIAPDGQTIVTGHADGVVRFWGVEKGAVVERHPPTPQPLLTPAADLSPDGRFAALDDGTRIHVWELEGLTSRPVTAPTDGARFAPTGDLIGIGLRHDVGGLLLVPSARAAAPPIAFADGFRTHAWSPDGKWIAAATRTELALWDVSASPPRERFERVPSVNAHGLWFTPDGRFIVGTGAPAADATFVRVWAVTARGPVFRSDARLAPGSHFALSPDGATAVVCGPAGLSRYDLKDGLFAPRGAFAFAVKPAWAEFSPDGRTLLAGFNDSTARLLSAATGAELHSWTLHGEPRYGRFHPDGRHVLVTNAVGTSTCCGRRRTCWRRPPTRRRGDAGGAAGESHGLQKGSRVQYEQICKIPRERS